VSRNFSIVVVFHQANPPRPLINWLKPFRMWLCIRRDIRFESSGFRASSIYSTVTYKPCLASPSKKPPLEEGPSHQNRQRLPAADFLSLWENEINNFRMTFLRNASQQAVLRIRNVYPGTRIMIRTFFVIPYPTSCLMITVVKVHTNFNFSPFLYFSRQ
jgi:hypothetical protein